MPKKLELTDQLLQSYKNAFGKPLLICPDVDDYHRLQSQELFILKKIVIAHDKQDDPCLIYANASALQLWQMSWDEMIGMPSRQTAPKDAQRQRQAILNKAITKTAIKGYRGIRVNKKGEKFFIDNVKIWTIWDNDNSAIGQAASFASWWNI